MTKRFFFALLITALAAGGAFAQVPLSAGVGGFFGGDFGGGFDFSGSRTYSYWYYGNELYRVTVDYADGMKMNQFGGGGYAFFDVYFAELTVGLYGGELESCKSDKWGTEEWSHSSVLNLQIGLLGKYPVPLTSRLTVFPLLGVDFALSLATGNAGMTEPPKTDTGGGYNDGDLGYEITEIGAVEPSYLSALWFKAGGGLDYAITRRIYIRFMALYGIRLPSKYETDEKASYEQYAAKYNKASNFTTRLGHGLDVKLAVGFKL